METLSIDRKTWLHGEGGLNSKLLRPTDDKKCCLGFYALQVGGCQLNDIRDRGDPEDIHMLDPKRWDGLMTERPNDASDEDETMPKYLVTELCGRLIHINDQCDVGDDLPNSSREQEITRLFAQIGVNVEFVGEY